MGKGEGQKKVYGLIGKRGVASARHIACGTIQTDLAGGNQHPAGKISGQCLLSTGPCTTHSRSFALTITTALQHTCIERKEKKRKEKKRKEKKRKEKKRKEKMVL